MGLTDTEGEPLTTLFAAAVSRDMSVEEGTFVEVRNLAFRDGDISAGTASLDRAEQSTAEVICVLISDNSAHAGGGITMLANSNTPGWQSGIPTVE